MRTHRLVPIGTLLVLAITANVPQLTGQTAEQAKPAENSAPTQEANKADKTGAGDAVVLSPFVVKSGADEGYSSSRTLAGSRVATDLLDLPSPVSIINKQLLDDFNAPDAQHVIGYSVSGVTANQTTYDDFYIRGFRASRAMRQGIAIPSYAPSPMFDLERIEVIKGPLALVLGDNAFLGGAVNFIPRAPTAQQAGEIKLSVDSYVDGEASTRVAVNNSGPIYNDGKGFSALYRVTLGGIAGKATKEIESHDQRFIGGALLFNYGPNTSLNIDWYRYQNNDRWGYDDFLDNRSTTVAILNPYSTATFSPGLGKDTPQKTRVTNLNAIFLTKLSENGNLRIAYGYNSFKYYSGNLFGNSLAADNYSLTSAYTRYDEINTSNVVQGDYTHRISFDKLTNEFTSGIDFRVTTAWAGEGPYTLLPALDTRHPDYSAELGRASSIAADFNPGLFASNYLVQARQTTTSYYVQDSISFWKDRIILVGASRWFQNRVTNADYVSNSYSETNQPALQVHKYGAVVKVLPWLSVYYLDATNEIPVVGFSNEDVPKPYHNQVGKDKEFGIKFDNKRLTDNISVYGSAASFDMALTNIKENSGQRNSAGQIIILQTAQNTNKGWDFDIGARAKYEGGIFDVLVTAYHGNARIPGNLHARGVPNNTFSILAKHSWTGGLLRDFMVGAGMHQTGVKFANGYRIDTPDLYDLFAGYKFRKNWDVQLNWYNVSNKRYVTAFASPAAVMTGMQGTVSLSTRYQW